MVFFELHGSSIYFSLLHHVLLACILEGLSTIVCGCPLLSAVSAVSAVKLSKEYCIERPTEGLYIVCFWWSPLVLFVLNYDVLCLLLYPDFPLKFSDLGKYGKGSISS